MRLPGAAVSGGMIVAPGANGKPGTAVSAVGVSR